MWRCIAVIWLAFGAAARADSLKIFIPPRPTVPQQQASSTHDFVVSLTTALSERTGDRYVLEPLPWSRSLAMAENGLGAMFGLSYTEQRARVFQFTEPVYVHIWNLVTRDDKVLPFATVADLQGLSLAVPQGRYAGDLLDPASRAGAVRLEVVESPLARLKMVLAGRVDVAIMTQATVRIPVLLRTDRELAAYQNRFVVLPTPLYLDTVHIAVPKALKADAIIKRFNDALASLRANGRYDEILARHSH